MPKKKMEKKIFYADREKAEEEADYIFFEIDKAIKDLENARIFLQDYLDGFLNEAYVRERRSKYNLDPDFYNKFGAEGIAYDKVMCLITRFMAQNSELLKD
jgi:hypothetical protein